MRPFARFASIAAVLCALSGPPLAAEIRSIPEDLGNWPVAATLDGTNVNLRAAPSTRSPVIGRFADERAAGELLVVASSRSDDGFPWFEVVSETAPKGWIFGKHLRRVGDGDDRVGRYCDRVRRDFGLTPAMAVAFFGEPDSRKTRRFSHQPRRPQHDSEKADQAQDRAEHNPRQQQLHQRLFLLLAIGQQLLSSADRLIPSGEDFGDFLLLWEWRQSH